MSDDDIINHALEILRDRFNRGDMLTSADDIRNYLTIKLSPYEYESFQIIFLDSQHRVILMNEMFRGTINAAAVYPREIVKMALCLNAAAIVLAHNHPSGIAEPSNADQTITQRIVEASALVDIKVLDHFVCAGGHSVSFAERGLM